MYYSISKKKFSYILKLSLNIATIIIFKIKFKESNNIFNLAFVFMNH